MISELWRLWHTVRWWRPMQFWGHLWFRLYRPRPDLAASAIAARGKCWMETLRPQGLHDRTDAFPFPECRAGACFSGGLEPAGLAKTVDLQPALLRRSGRAMELLRVPGGTTSLSGAGLPRTRPDRAMAGNRTRFRCDL